MEAGIQRQREEMNKGDVMYLVGWRNGYPFIKTGRIVQVGKTNRSLRLKMDTDGYVSSYLGSSSIQEAIEKEMLSVSSKYGNGNGGIMRDEGEGKPWLMLKLLVRINRLAKKLRRHNLIQRMKDLG